MKKRIVAVILVVVLGAMSMGAYMPPDSEGVYKPLAQQKALHEIAEYARSLGFSEDSLIIIQAQKLWHKAQEQFCEDRDIIATVVYNEAWGGCSARHRDLVAAVVVNRLHSNKFPNTIYDVVVQKNQYHPAYANPNSYYGRRARADAGIWATCQEIATRALRGEIECDPSVLYQANFRQGTGVYEIHKTSYSTTYFCYG